MFRKNWLYDPAHRTTPQCSIIWLRPHHLEKCRDQEKSGTLACQMIGGYHALALDCGSHLPRMVSVQNEYSLLCRLFDLDMAELAHANRLVYWLFHHWPQDFSPENIKVTLYRQDQDATLLMILAAASRRIASPLLMPMWQLPLRLRFLRPNWPWHGRYAAPL